MAKRNNSIAQDVHQKPSTNVEELVSGSVGPFDSDSGAVNGKQSQPGARTYDLTDYGSVTVDAGCAEDFATRRARQLHSLLQITQGESDFHGWNVVIKDSVIDLAIELANDMKRLIPMISADATDFAMRGAR
jgi:hypothetical protein